MQNACRGCHLFSTKAATFESFITDDEAEEYFLEVEQVRRMRDSSGELHLTKIDFVTWQLLMIYDDEIEKQERSLRLYARALFEALASRGI